ncbi:hypothetical protein ABT071_15035 [Streptomyces sp. NPDC002506]|uniref:hypothetical protein n=1 Tax=Streptomyces sp. NPDC002506 TaxID=3154536 RepID=UPI00332834B6
MAAREVRSAPLGHQVERHADVVAVLAGLGGPVAAPGGRVGGVGGGAARAGGLTASLRDDSWMTTGRKPYCSGAHSCTNAQVTVLADDGRRFFAVRTGLYSRLAGCRSVEGSWEALGMAASDSADAIFTDVRAIPACDA